MVIGTGAAEGHTHTGVGRADCSCIAVGRVVRACVLGGECEPGQGAAGVVGCIVERNNVAPARCQGKAVDVAGCTGLRGVA